MNHETLYQKPKKKKGGPFWPQVMWMTKHRGVVGGGRQCTGVGGGTGWVERKMPGVYQPGWNVTLCQALTMPGLYQVLFSHHPYSKLCGSSYCHSHFPDEETEVQTHKAGQCER